MARHSVLWLLALTPMLAALALQLAIDQRVYESARSAGAEATRSWVPGSVRLSPSSLSRGKNLSATLRSATLATGLIRRRCDQSLTFGLGVTSEVQNFEASVRFSSSNELSTQAASFCVDIDLPLSRAGLGARVAQHSPLALDGTCGPEISGVLLSRDAMGTLTGAATLTDRGRCLSQFAELAGKEEKAFVPKSVELAFSAANVDWNIRPLKGKSPVALASELSTRVQNANLSADLTVTAESGEQAGLCFKKSQFPERAEFELGVGLSETALFALTEPWLDQDARQLLLALRTDVARCNAQGDGLLFDSELLRLLLKGQELKPQPRRAAEGGWLRAQPCASRKPAPGNCRYQIAVVEFDEHGDFAQPEQLEQTLAAIKKEHAEGVLLSVFIHGWRHSAGAGDSNLRDFTALTESIAAMETSSAPVGEEPRRVIGVYLAWPARLYRSAAANKLATFWDRLKVARKLGKSGGALRQTLDSLATATSEANLLVTDPLRRSAMFVGGHSMGADALLGAFADPGTAGAPTGDLVLLVNPAISSARFRAAQKHLSAATTPLLVYGSVSDEITQQFYPLGAALTFDGKTRDALSQHTTTVANDPSLVTHRLSLADARKAGPYSPSTLSYGALRLPKRATLLGGLSNFWDSQVYRLASSEPAAQGTPQPERVSLEQSLEPWYKLVLCAHQQGEPLRAPCQSPIPDQDRVPDRMIVAVDGQIIKSHANFFAAPFMEHVARIIGASLFANAPPATPAD